jgi:RNase P subunit RPR2
LATQAYCVKCKTTRDMEGEKRVTMKNGRSATSGICTVCGTKMFKIGGGGKTTVAKAKTASKKPAKKAAKTKPKKKKK